MDMAPDAVTAHGNVSRADWWNALHSECWKVLVDAGEGLRGAGLGYGISEAERAPDEDIIAVEQHGPDPSQMKSPQPYMETMRAAASSAAVHTRNDAIRKRSAPGSFSGV